MALIVNCKSQDSQYWNRNELTVAYFEDIKKYPVLSIDEERELLSIYKNGNKFESEKALHKLVECNQRFVVSVARRWCNSENLMDVVNEGNIGLIKAISCFDLDKKQRLITYAVFWIRKYITNYVSTTSKIIKPVNAHKIFTYVNKTVNRFFAENGRNPYIEEIQDILKTKHNIVLCEDDIMQYTVSSIDAKSPFSDTDDNSVTFGDVGEFAQVTASNEINTKIEENSLKYYVQTILSILTPRERDIIKSYYGIDCETECLDNIATKHNLTRERCRQIVIAVIDKLKDNLIDKNVK